jgi:hypothetical protein
VSTFDIGQHLAALVGHPDRTAAAAPTVLLCLPARASTSRAVLHSEVAHRLRDGLGVSAAALCPGHLYAQSGLHPLEQRLLVDPQPTIGPLHDCAGGPLGLLDFTHSAAFIADVAADEHVTWSQIVDGTPDAIPLSDLVHALAHDLPGAVAAYCAQPRISAMLAANQRGDATFLPDDYGPLLAAYQAGPAEHRRYLIDVMQLGDALLDLDGTLIAPAPLHQPRLTHSLAQCRAYHDEARRRLRTANPTTLLVACHIHVSPQRSFP